MTVARVFLMLMLMFSAAAWSSEDAAQLEALQAAKAKWDAAKLDSYSFVVSFSFSFRAYTPALVTVWKERIRGATYTKWVRAHPGRRVPRNSPLRVTVPDLFQMIENALHSDSELIMAKYDAGLGHPVEFIIDEGRGELTDLGFRYEVTRLKPSR